MKEVQPSMGDRRDHQTCDEQEYQPAIDWVATGENLTCIRFQFCHRQAMVCLSSHDGRSGYGDRGRRIGLASKVFDDLSFRDQPCAAFTIDPAG